MRRAFDDQVVVLEPRVFEDERGFFLEAWNRRSFEELGIDAEFVQANQSRSRRGVLRGMHFQWPNPQGKLLWVVTGRVFDVVVDVRPDSPSFGRWEGFEISSENQHRVWVPPGFAHGFYVLSESADLIYKCTDFYAPKHERTLLWNDRAVGIGWPLDPDAPLVVSAKDAEGQPLEAFRTLDG